MKLNRVFGFFGFVSLVVVVVTSVNVNSFAQDNGIWIAPSKADKLKNPFAADDNAWEKVENSFNTLCVVCHGEGGEGDGIAGMGLTPKPADLVSEGVQKQSDGAIYWKLTNGRSPMAAYKDALSDDQRWQLVKYLRHLAE